MGSRYSLGVHQHLQWQVRVSAWITRSHFRAHNLLYLGEQHAHKGFEPVHQQMYCKALSVSCANHTGWHELKHGLQAGQTVQASPSQVMHLSSTLQFTWLDTRIFYLAASDCRSRRQCATRLTCNSDSTMTCML